MSDTVWLAVIGVVALVVKEYFDARRAKAAAEKVAQVAVATGEAAGEVAEVKQTLRAATSKTDDKLDTIHGLVNSAMAEMKRIYMAKCRAMADETKNPVDVAEAEAATEAYERHLEQQARADAQERLIIDARNRGRARP